MAELAGLLTAGLAGGIGAGMQQNAQMQQQFNMAQMQNEMKMLMDERIAERARTDKAAEGATAHGYRMEEISAEGKAKEGLLSAKTNDPENELRSAQAEQIRANIARDKQQTDLQKQRDDAFDVANNDKATPEERASARKVYNTVTAKLNSLQPAEKTKVTDDFGGEKLADKRKTYEPMSDPKSSQEIRYDSKGNAFIRGPDGKPVPYKP